MYTKYVGRSCPGLHYVLHFLSAKCHRYSAATSLAQYPPNTLSCPPRAPTTPHIPHIHFDKDSQSSSSCFASNGGCRCFHREREPAGGSAGADGAGIGGRVVRERRPSAAADAVRCAGRAAGDGAEGADARRAILGVRGVRRGPGRRAVQGRLLARLLRQPHGLAPRLAGAAGGAWRVHGGVRPRWLRRERPGPAPVAGERGAGHPGPRRRARPRRQVPPHLLLPRLPRRLGLRQVHPTQAGRSGDDGAGDKLPVVGAAEGAGTSAVPAPAAGRPVVAPRGLLRAVAAALVDEPVMAAHLHRRQRLRLLPQRPRREEPPHGPLHRNVPKEGTGGHAAGGAGILLPRHGGDVRAVAGVRADGPRGGAAVPGAPLPGRRGRRRAGAAAAAHMPPARLGQLPRARRGGALPVGGAGARRQDHQHPIARAGG
ncbi:hypothetical protein ACQJBY_001849 [Aegilops geniculata]